MNVSAILNEMKDSHLRILERHICSFARILPDIEQTSAIRAMREIEILADHCAFFSQLFYCISMQYVARNIGDGRCDRRC